MEWNTIIPFIGFGGIITVATILYKFSYKNGRQDCRLDILEKRVFTNEEKSITSTNNANSDISNLEKIMMGVDSKIDTLSAKIENLDKRVTSLEQRDDR